MHKLTDKVRIVCLSLSIQLNIPKVLFKLLTGSNLIVNVFCVTARVFVTLSTFHSVINPF